MGLLSRFSRRGRGVAPFSAEEEKNDPQVDIFRNLQKQKRLLPPDGSPYAKKRTYWRRLLLILLLYDSLAMPFQCAFWDELEPSPYELPVAQCVLVYVIDILFWVDMAIRFRTTYVSSIEEGNELITDPKLIAKRYYRKGFVLDLVATVPIELFAAFLGMRSLEVHALRLNRLLRFTRIFTLHTAIFSLSRFKRLCCFFSFFLVFAHWVGCSWWALGNSKDNIDNPKGYAPWMDRLPHGGLSLMQEPLAAQYFGCFYWAVTTLMKVPWIAPMTVPEAIFAIVLSLMGAITFALLIGEVTQIISKLNEGYRNKNEAITTMRSFCTSRKVPADVQSKIYSWLVADQEFGNKYAGKQAALSALPKTLRTEVLLLVHKEVLADCPLTKGINSDVGLSSESIGMMAMHLNPITMLKKQVLIDEGSISTQLYLLQRGSLRLAAPMPAEEDGFKAKTSKRMSCAVQKKGGDRKQTKVFGRFRLLERAGALVGLPAIDGTARFPFQIESVKLSHMMCVSKAALRQARGQMSSQDATKFTSMIAKEHSNHVESLKFTIASKAPPPVDKNDQAIAKVLAEKNALNERSTICLDALEVMASQTSALPGLVEMLQSGDFGDENGGGANSSAPATATSYSHSASQGAKKKKIWKRNTDEQNREEEDWEGLKEATQVAAVSATVM